MNKQYELGNIIAVGNKQEEFIDRRTGEVLYFPNFYGYHLAKTKSQRLKQEQKQEQN